MTCKKRGFLNALGTAGIAGLVAACSSPPEEPAAAAAAANADPTVIFTCDFERENWYEDWGLQQPPRNTALVAADPELRFTPLSGTALRIRVVKDAHYGTSFRYNFQPMLGHEPEAIYWRYYLRLADDWDPRQGGKLPGIGGTYGRGGWGGRPADGSNGWSARGQFNGQKDGLTPTGFYCYHADMSGRYGNGWIWNDEGLGQLRNNRWYCIEHHAKMNTPGQNDGVLEGWVDGRKAFSKKNIRMRDVDTLKIECIWIDVYHGGSWAAPSDDHIYIDNVVIASAYIGPDPQITPAGE